MPNHAKKIGLYLHDDDMSFHTNFLVQKSVSSVYRTLDISSGWRHKSNKMLENEGYDKVR